jgi:Predicted transcriptional regulators
MKIAEACRETGISKSTIHFYISEKLISPKTDPENGYYIFEEEDISRLIFCRNFRNVGVPIPEIRSLLRNPLTAGHYLNLHIQKLMAEKTHLQKEIDSMQYILTNLPFSPDLSDLYLLEKEAHIPDPLDESSARQYDAYTISLVNRLLCGNFISTNQELNEYQEFLWNKLNRMVLAQHNEDYLALFHLMQRLDAASIEQLYSRQDRRREYIFSLDDEGCRACAEEMIPLLEKRVHETKLHVIWKRFYHEYFAPITRIYASQYSVLMNELSPYFAGYAKNIDNVLNMVYDYLKSPEGNPLYDELRNCFGSYLDMERSNHGELEALVELPVVGMVLNSKISAK